jgi:hypothetical protein
VHAGLEGVLGRSRSNFTLEYQTDGPAGERWAVLSVVPLSGAQGGAVITHTDITERRRAQIEAERSRQELAHFARVSAMGELTASLAHQLNQPLAGIWRTRKPHSACCTNRRQTCRSCAASSTPSWKTTAAPAK